MLSSVQNTPLNLGRLSACDLHYRRAQQLSLLRFLLCALLPALLDFGLIWNVEITFYVRVLMIYCAFACILNRALTSMIKSSTGKAARFYQLFETELLRTQWSPYFCGPMPQPDEECLASGKERNLDRLRNWFQFDTEGLSRGEQAVCCFKIDVMRMSRFQVQYYWRCVWLLILCEVLIIMPVCLLHHFNFHGIMFFLILPTAPVVLWFFTLREQLQKSDKQLYMVQQMISDQMPQSGNKGNACNNDLNDLIQSYLYLSRQERYVIQDWFFSRKAKAAYDARIQSVIEIVRSNILAAHPTQE